MSVLELAVGDDVALHDPVLIVALAGWFDAGRAATSAGRLIAGGDSVTVGEIDPDPFYDFTVVRPLVEITGGERSIRWPGNAFRAVRTGGRRDVVVLDGVEPHVAWSTYVDCVVDAARRLRTGLVVTLGAVADGTPHTRPPVVVGSTTDPVLAAKHRLRGPSYQGPTGVIGVLHAVLDEAGVPSVSLRVGVPGYLPEGEHPRAVAALLGSAAKVAGVRFDVDLAESIRMWDDAHDTWVARDPRMRAYLALLEQHYDSRVAGDSPD